MRTRLMRSLLVAALIMGGCHDSDSTANPNPNPDTAPDVAMLALSVDATGHIVDSAGREVLLRGANITSLGDYYQGDPANPPTKALTAEDWDEMASYGFSVVRLIVHWSLIEPSRGEIDAGYLDRVDAAVREADAHGIYTVIDMHQDAYTATIHTPPGEVCPEGTKPAVGWDGAPAWATITDGASTCTPGERNASPAVRNAWNHFWDNTDGIRDRLVASWRAVAQRFAGRTEVAGYDILNEPEVSRPAAELTPLYDAFIKDAVTAIREAEQESGAPHLLFVEPAIGAGNPAFGLVIPDPNRIGLSADNVVSAPHNYAESIPIAGLQMTLEGFNTFALDLAKGFNLPTWYGEYGFWDTSASTLEKLKRYAADEDRHLLGGAWWQWRQPCGDPHSLGDDQRTVQGITHLHHLDCPGDRNDRPTKEFLDVLGRGYPRAAPGQLTELVSDPASGTLTIRGKATAAGGELEVWTPTQGATHHVAGTGLGEIREEPRGSGRIIRAVVSAAGPYSLTVAP